MAGVRETWVRSFTVTDPTNHEKGFTVYKVSYKAFPLSRPEETIEVIVWKRYNDFKKLHKALSALHYNLRRPEKFPEFAKAKIFGRFEDGVIEERRKSALNLLEFASRVPVLAKSPLMQNFFKGGEKVIRKLPAEPTILQPSNVHRPAECKSDLELPDPTPSELSSTMEVTRGRSTGDNQEGSSVGLGGVWLHRQDEDSQDEEGAEDYVYEGSDDERTTFSEDSLPSTPLAQFQDISVFDPLAGDDVTDAPPSLHTSNSWLFHAMDLCADLKGSPDQSEESSLANSSTDLSSTEGGITIKLPQVPDSVPLDEPPSDPAVLPVTQDLGYTNVSVTDGPSRDNRSSMAQAYLRCIRAQEAADRDAQLGVSSGIVDSREATPSPSPQHDPGRSRSVSGDSISKLIVRGEEDYLFKAAQAIGLALQNEANGFYQAAFDSYKAGVSILLNGVAGETNKTRREAVRKKTAQYLMRAEDVYNNYLSDMDNSKRWESETLAVESDPSSEHLRGSIDELKQYKVLGVVDRVMLVLDMSSYQTFVIKVLNKCAVACDRVRTCVPSHCPYMVRLTRFIEGDTSIYLVLEHASGGKLWDYVSSYLNQEETESRQPSVLGQKVAGTRSQSPQSPRARSPLVERTSPFHSSAVVDSRREGTHSRSLEKGVFGEAESPSKLSHGDERTTKVLERLDDNTRPRTEEKEKIQPPFIFMTRDDNLKEGSEVKNGINTKEGNSTKVNAISPVADPQRDKEESWIGSSSSSSDGNSEVNSTQAVPGGLLPPLDMPLGNGSQEFDNVEEGDSLNDLVEQSYSYRGEIGQRTSEVGGTGGGGTEGEESSASQRFSLFSFDSTEDTPNLAQGNGDSQIDSGSISDAGNCIQDSQAENQHSELHPEGTEFVISNPTGDDVCSHDYSNSLDEFGLGVSGKEHTRQIGTSASSIGRTKGYHLEDGPGGGKVISREDSIDSESKDNVFGEHNHSSYGNSANEEQNLENGIKVLEEDVVLSPSRKRSSKWDEFFELNESKDQPHIADEKPESSKGDSLRNSNIRKIGESEGATGEFNVCVNPFEIGHGATKTCVTMDDPSQPRKTSVEVIKEWPSSSTNSNTSTPKKQLTGAKSKIATEEADTSLSSINCEQNDKAGSLDKRKDKSNISIKGNTDNVTKPSHSNGPAENATSKDDDPTPKRDARLPSISKLFSQLDVIRRSQGAVHLPESCIRIWAAEMAMALSSLHAYGIICRDLNPANILLAQGGHIRLTYFSHWKCIRPVLSAAAVENLYIAPEVHSLQPVTPACDWWSYGVLLFELLTGRSLHSCHPCGISTHTELAIPDHVSNEGRGLLKQLIQPVPHERLGSGRSGAGEIRAHPFFAGVDWSTLRG